MLAITTFDADSTSIGIVILSVTLYFIFDYDIARVERSVRTVYRVFEIECPFIIVDIIVTVPL